MTHEIGVWLEKLGLGKYTEAFLENDIEVEVLSKLTEQDLKDLSLTIGHRRTLRDAISRHLESAGIAPLPPPSPAMTSRMSS